MIKNYLRASLLLMLVLTSVDRVNAQTNFTSTEYKKALWMTTRMYGGQRSGDKNTTAANWLLIGHPNAADGRTFLKDADGSYDLSGGWFDCGDHVKFGQTQYFSAYMLLKGYAEFYKGYDDRYGIDYAGYKTANNYTFEGSGHKPNGIPDILDEAKHATDFIIKCTRDPSTFYYQVGDASDHNHWVTAAKMQTLGSGQGGEPRAVFKNPADGSMTALAAGALALMSRLYKPYDATYAATCLTHAKYALAYAAAHKGQSATDATKQFYTTLNSSPVSAYVSALAEMYWATKDEAYKTEALAYTVSLGGKTDLTGTTWGLDYVNTQDLGIFNLYLLGKSEAATALLGVVQTNYLGQVQADGQYSAGNKTYGPLRYNGGASFVVALWANRNQPTAAMKKFIYNNIDYILGKNSKNYSFVVGFKTGATHPHHRNVFMSDADNNANLTIPSKNLQHGYMVGGSRDPNSYQDVTNSYQYTEGGIDYSAGLVGALAWINADLAPVTTTFPAVEVIPTPIVTAINESLDVESMVVFPNPSSSQFEVNAPENTTIRVFNELGIMIQEFNTSECQNFGAEIKSGLFHVSFYRGDKLRKSVNVVKN